jgi:general secretion pathway protein E
VLSTLHTNTAVGAITRLRDMGVEPFLLSSTLLGVLAQRLVRVVDPSTAESVPATDYEKNFLNVPAKESVELKRPGTARGNGFRGRTGIHEIVLIDETMRQLIHDGAGEMELERYARTLTPSIRDDGRQKILSGTTTVEEVLRVTRED